MPSQRVTLVTALGVPRPLVAMVVVMLAVLAAVGAVNLIWKLSGHTAVAAGSFAVLTILYGPLAAAAGTATVPLIAWSRVHLHDHTSAQVTAGAILGAALAAPLFVLFA